MSKKDDFKLFASKHPELVKYIKNGQSTWQKFYEIYDIYGEEESAWKDYIGVSYDYNLKAITDKLKNIDFNSIQEHINTAQKALGVVQELTSKGSATKASTEIINPRPINKIFED
jgi:phenylalanyl-tRNA synthetase beta subunit